MNVGNRAVRIVGVSLASILTLLLVWGPAGAFAAPQEPWSLPATNLSGDGQSAMTPRVAFAPDGRTTVVWARSNGTHNIIQASIRPPGGDFGLPQDLSAAGQNAYSPQVEIAPDGSTTVVWTRLDGTNFIVQAATRPTGGVFSAPVGLSAAGEHAFAPQIAIAPDGSTTAVWYRLNGTNYIIQAATRPPGGDFGLPQDISATGQNALNPRVAAAPDGSITVVWPRSNGTYEIVQASTRPPGGTFELPQNLSADGQNAYAPQIAAAPDGGTTVIWSRFDGANGIVQATTRPPGGSFALPVDLSAAGQSASSPQIAIAPDGGATAAWYRYNGANYIIQASTRPVGGSYSAPVDLSGTGQDAYIPQIATAPDGTATVVWHRTDGTFYVIQASTRPPGGSFGSPVDLSAAGQASSTPQIAAGVDGRTTAVWVHNAGPNTVIQSASTAQPSPALNVTRSGTGHGKVVSSPAGIDCGTSCASSYLSYTKVTLTATANPGSSFSGWDGACSGTAPSCEVTMLEAESVNARFGLSCKKATLKTGRFKANRRKGTGTLKVTTGSAGTVTLKGSKTVRKSTRKLTRKGTFTLKIKAKGKAAKKLRRNGSARLNLKLSFRPANGCKAKARTRTVKLVR